MVKNEEKYLDQCLSSLKPIIDNINSEIIIVDTGSDDRTVEIAKHHTDRIYFHQWNNDFANMRNKTIEYATGQWIFVLDGDEIVENATEIVRFLSSKKSKHYNTAMLIIESITSEEQSISIGALRVFRNTRTFRYEGIIHEQPQYQEPIYMLDAKIKHYGYISTDKDLMELKFQRNTELLNKALESDPENIYYWYQLAVSYGMYKDYEKSLEMNIKAYNIAKRNKIDFQNRMYIYTHLALAYYWNEKYVELENICLEAIEVDGSYIDLFYYLGKSQKQLMKYKQAIHSYEKYLEILNKQLNSPKKNISVVDMTVNNYEEVYLDLSMLYKKMDDKEKALKYIKKIKEKSIVAQAIPHIVETYIDLNMYNELKTYYTNLMGQNKKFSYLFWAHVESNIKKLEKNNKDKIIKLFSKGNCEYSILNTTRLAIKDNSEIDNLTLQSIRQLDFNELPAFFADITYYLLRNQYDIKDVLKKNRDYTIETHIQYLSGKYKDLSKYLLSYLQQTMEGLGLSDYRIRKILSKNVLILDDIKEEVFREVWDSYIETGTYYIAQVYNHIIIESEMIYDVKNDEDAFLVYMLLAQRNKDIDMLEYIKYLRKALKSYPDMKKGIEILLEEIQEQQNNKEEVTSQGGELELYKKQVKDNIRNLINNGEIEEALVLIRQYEEMVESDIETYSMKAVILMMQGNMKEAEIVLLEGLEIQPHNDDLLHNLKYLYKTVGEDEKAEQIIIATEKQEVIEHNEIKNKTNAMQELKKKFKTNIQSLIEKGFIQEAKDILREYQQIAINDIDIYSIKGVIAMIEGDVEKAEIVLKKGLLKNPLDVDILYNLAYLSEMQENYITAYRYYKKIVRYPDVGTAAEVGKRIEELKEIDSVRRYSNRKKVLMIAYAFPPIGGSGIQRTLKFAKYLRAFEWEPIILTVGKTAWYMKDESMLNEIPEEVEIIRIDDVKIEEIDNHFMNKLINFYSTLISDKNLYKEYIKKLNSSQENLEKHLFIPEYQSGWAMKVCESFEKYIDIKEIDVIYTTADPYANTFIGYYLKNNFQKPWVADFRDEWTNHHYKQYDKNDVRYKIEYAMETSVVNKADKIITTTEISSNNYRKIFKLPKENVETITNGYDESDFEEIKEKEEKNKTFTIMHNGLFHDGKNPITFLQALSNLIERRLVDKEKIKVYFTREDPYLQLVKGFKNRNIVKYLGYIEHKKSLEIANSCDALLLVVGQGEKLKQVHAAKLFEYLRLGKPILSLAPKEGVIDKLLKELNRGYNIEYSNIKGIEQAILSMYQKWEKGTQPRYKLTEKVTQFERKNLTRRLSDVFMGLYSNNAIKNNIEELIEKGELIKAKDLILTYKKASSNDVEIHSMESVIAILEGNLNRAKEIIFQGIKIDKNNVDLWCNLAYIYKLKGQYLKSLETYEKLVFSMQDNPERLELIQTLNNLENEYKEELQRQLEEREVVIEETCNKSIKTTLHLMYDSQYCDKFIRFMNERFPNENHKFIVVANSNYKLSLISTNNLRNVEVLDLKYDLQKLINHINDCSRIFIHFLFDYICELVCKLNINKPLHWILWGGDFYYYIEMELYDPMTKKILVELGINNNTINKNTINYLYRKSTIRRMNYILMSDDLEYKMVKNIFITNAKYKKFIYPNPTNVVEETQCKIEEAYDYKKRYKYVILLGNSADPSNNHLDMINMCAKIKSNHFCVIVPLSYGGSKAYIDQIILKGKQVLGTRFIPIVDYLESDMYKNILNQVDVAIFNHNRAQARGNIRTLLSLGKKVYVKKCTTTYHSFRKMGIQIYDIESVENIEDINAFIHIPEDEKDGNCNRIVKFFRLEECERIIKELDERCNFCLTLQSDEQNKEEDR